jgi:hypothetical protein
LRPRNTRRQLQVEQKLLSLYVSFLRWSKRRKKTGFVTVWPQIILDTIFLFSIWATAVSVCFWNATTRSYRVYMHNEGQYQLWFEPKKKKRN